MSTALDPQLFARHDVAGPRYTSYPTVPVWSDDFGSDAFGAQLDEARAAGADLPLSLYLHLPFCKKMCTYCGCNVVISRNRERHEEYVEALSTELAMVADRLGDRRDLAQLHYGGGTPTSLDEALLAELWRGITRAFRVLPDAELSIEVDPVVTSRGQLELLRGMGFSRISMGVQDFTPEVQRAVNRSQSVEETEALAGYARQLGFRGVHFDLIYGLPLQREETFTQTIREVIRIGPDRIALFSYAHVPALRAHQRKIDTATLPQGLVKYGLFCAAKTLLLDAGYVEIGMDHFARPEDELAHAQNEGRLYRNFQGYTVRPPPDALGLGVTGISDLRDAFAQNVRPLGTYYAAIRAGRFATCKGMRLSEDDRLRRDAIGELMCNFALDLGALANRHEHAASLEPCLTQLTPLVEEGLVELEGQQLRVTTTGRPFVREVAMAFDAYLRVPTEGAGPTFSRVL